MEIGKTGTFVLGLDQMQLDDRPCAGLLQTLNPSEGISPELGQVWSWSGQPIRLEGTLGAVRLEDAIGNEHLRDRVKRRAGRTLGSGPVRDPLDAIEIPYLQPERERLSRGFIVSDGLTSYTLVPIGQGRNRGVWCATGLPESGKSYLVIQVAEPAPHTPEGQADDVICFTRGSRIATPEGSVAVEELRRGDFVSTRDDGAQEVLWIGQRHISGARLHVMPHLRPVRIRARALGPDQPDTDLLVSPKHRVLVRTDKARALFGADEVLVGADDLIDNRLVYTDHSVKSVDYFHLLLPRHAVLWANGVASESYHPASTSLETVDPDQRVELLDLLPELGSDLHSYGPYARRNLNRPEAVVLMGSDT